MTPTPPQHGNEQRIAIVRLSHLGDVVHALPVFHALRAAHPKARIAWVVQREFAGLLRGMTGLDEVILFERRGGLGAWLRLRRELRAFHAELAVDCQGNWKSAIATRLTGAKRRVGMVRERWREGAAARLCNEFPGPGELGPHAVEPILQLAQWLAPGHDPRAPGGFHLGLSEAEFKAGAAELAERFRDLPGEDPSAPGPRPVLLHLGCPDNPRSWPAAHFGQLARLLAKAGHPVLLLSGPAEASEGRQLAAELADERGIAHWPEQRDLRQLASFFAAAAQHGTAMVSADSGPMHLAWASGLDVVLIAGPQDPRVTGPWVPSGPHRVLHAPDFPCTPCLKRKCEVAPGDRFAPCMEAVTPHQVLDVIASE
jgi:heptosyltransferase-1